MADMSHDTRQTVVAPSDDATSQGTTITVSFDQLLLLDGAIRDCLVNARARDLWLVVQRRFGFAGSKPMTLEEIARILGVTSRERVRQKEANALKILTKVLLRQGSESGGVAKEGATEAAVDALHDFLVRRRPTIREDTLYADIAAEFAAHEGIDKLRPTIAVFLAILRFQRCEVSSELPGLWTTLRGNDRSKLAHQVAAIHSYSVQHGSVRQDLLTVLSKVNERLSQKEWIRRQDAPGLFALCSSIEIINDMVQTNFEYLKGRENQVERLLSERMEPMSTQELAREINHRLVPLGHRKVTARNLSNQISQDERFIPIGRSGTWGLRTWEHVTTESIVNLMERFLIIRNSPAPVNEIYEYVRKYRPVKPNSIVMYLGNNSLPGGQPTFKRMGPTGWGLTSWASTPEHLTWNETDVAELVSKLLRKHRVKELDYKQVKQALMQASGLSARQAQGKLNHNARLTVRRESSWGRRFVALTSLEQMKQTPIRPYKRRTATIREQVTQLVCKKLADAPDNALPLDRLVAWLQTQVACPKPTLYRYIDELDLIEKRALVGSRSKLCCLVSVNTELFPEVSTISPETLRHEVERAVKNLTVEQVDIGLFMLGRAFEQTLKACLVAGIQRGNVSIPQLQSEPAKWKLVTMVDAAKAAGIIQDASALHYLRVERNDRAHGEIPSLQEREALMAGIKSLAGMYIKYIILLSDQHSVST